MTEQPTRPPAKPRVARGFTCGSCGRRYTARTPRRYFTGLGPICLPCWNQT